MSLNQSNGHRKPGAEQGAETLVEFLEHAQALQKALLDAQGDDGSGGEAEEALALLPTRFDGDDQTVLLKQRYYEADQLLRVVIHLLKDQDTDPQGYFQQKLNNALARFNLQVTPVRRKAGR